MGLHKLLYREILIQWSLKPLAWTQLLYPVMYIFIAGLSYGSLIKTITLGGHHIPYVQFLIPGIVVSQVMVASTFAGQTFAMDRRTRMFSQILMLPYARWEYLVSKVFGVVVRAWVTALAVSVIASPILVGVRFTAGKVVLSLFAVSMVAVFFGSLMFLTSGFVSSQEAVNTIFSIVAIPFLFLSSVFYPLEALPAGIRPVAAMNPLSVYAELLRYTWLSVPFNVALRPAGVSLLANVVLVALAVWAFHRGEP